MLRVWWLVAALGLVLPLRSLRAQSAADDLVRRAQAVAAAAHPDAVAARAALAAAEAAVRTAGARAPAALTAEAEQLGGGAPVQVRFDIVQDWGARALRSAERARAAAVRDVAAAQSRLVVVLLSARAGRELASWLGWRAIHERLGAEDSLLAEAEEALRARFSVGTARYVDVLRVRSERVRVQLERASASRESGRARVVLASFVPAGHADAAVFRAQLDSLAAMRAPPPAAPPVPPDPESLVVAAGGAVFLEAQTAEAQQRARLLRAGRRPSVVTSLGVQRYAGDRAAQIGPTVGVGISLPFTVGAAGSALVPAAEALVAAAQAERAAALARLRSALAVGRERYQAALDRLSVLGTALLVGAREEREAALGAFRAGDFSLLELLDLERALARVDIERVRAAMDAATALADLYAAAAGESGAATFHGGGSDDR